MALIIVVCFLMTVHIDFQRIILYKFSELQEKYFAVVKFTLGDDVVNMPKFRCSSTEILMNCRIFTT